MASDRRVGWTARSCAAECAFFAVVVAVFCPAANSSAAPVTGTMHATAPSGQQLSMTMTIGDTTTTFALVGPSYSWFSIGFDTTTMEGYSLIVEGLNDSRTVVEQNLLGSGSPGSPQVTQNLKVLSTSYDAIQNLTTILLERANDTGDPHDPVFTTSISSLDLIWAYRGSATPASPSPTLNYHGRNGRGDTAIVFLPVPEPAAAATLVLAATVIPLGRFWRSRRWPQR